MLAQNINKSTEGHPRIQSAAHSNHCSLHNYLSPQVRLREMRRKLRGTFFRSEDKMWICGFWLVPRRPRLSIVKTYAISCGAADSVSSLTSSQLSISNLDSCENV